MRSIRAFFKGFQYAARGVWRAVCEERNLRFHLCAAFYVLLFSVFYPFGVAQYCILAILIGGVVALELVNTAVERIVDKLSPERSRHAGAAKDAAAGAVLVFALAAAVCGVLLFWDLAVFGQIIAWFAGRLWALGLLALSLAGWGWFVFGFKAKGQKRRNEAPASPQNREDS